MSRKHTTLCAPGIQNEVCRICGKTMMEGNGARWAHDNCIEKEKAKDGKIHLPSPFEIDAMCAEFRANRGHNGNEVDYDDLTTENMKRDDYMPRVHKLHTPHRRGRTVT